MKEQMIQEQLQRSLKLAGLPEKGIFESVSNSELEFLSESIMLNENVVDSAVKNLSKYRMMFLENGTTEWFFFDSGSKVVGSYYTAGVLMDTVEFKNEKEATEFIKFQIGEGFVARRNENQIKKIFKTVLGSLSKFVRKVGIVGIVVGVVVTILAIGMGIASYNHGLSNDFLFRLEDSPVGRFFLGAGDSTFSKVGGAEYDDMSGQIMSDWGDAVKTRIDHLSQSTEPAPPAWSWNQAHNEKNVVRSVGMAATGATVATAGLVATAGGWMGVKTSKKIDTKVK